MNVGRDESLKVTLSRENWVGQSQLNYYKALLVIKRTWFKVLYAGTYILGVGASLLKLTLTESTTLWGRATP